MRTLMTHLFQLSYLHHILCLSGIVTVVLHLRTLGRYTHVVLLLLLLLLLLLFFGYVWLKALER